MRSIRLTLVTFIALILGLAANEALGVTGSSWGEPNTEVHQDPAPTLSLHRFSTPINRASGELQLKALKRLFKFSSGTYRESSSKVQPT
jgi:hypothetical protein